MNDRELKINLINLQQLAQIGFIIALLIGYFLSYDKKLKLQNKKGIFSNKESQNIALFQNILIFIIALTFLYISYKQYKIAKKENGNSKDFFLQIETSLLSFIAAVIGVYIVVKNYRNSTFSISEIENI